MLNYYINRNKLNRTYLNILINKNKNLNNQIFIKNIIFDVFI